MTLHNQHLEVRLKWNLQEVCDVEGSEGVTTYLPRLGTLSFAKSFPIYSVPASLPSLGFWWHIRPSALKLMVK